MAQQLQHKHFSAREKQVADFYDWLHSEAGRPLKQAISSRLEPWLENVHGLHQLLLGTIPEYFAASRVANYFSMSPCDTLKPSVFLSDSATLPFASDSFDLVSLGFELDFAEQPLTVLNEVARVLVPGGHLIIVGFNTLSAHGLRRLFYRLARRRQPMPYQLGRLSPFELNRWLGRFGLAGERTETGYRYPVGLWSGIHRLVDGCRLGSVYFIKARKEVPGMTPVGLSQPQFQLVSDTVVRPAPQHRAKPLQYRESA